MQMHADIVELASEVPAPLRVPLIVRAAGLTFSAIERSRGLTRGSISSYAGGRTYAYPKLRAALVAEIAAALGESEDDVRACLFPAAAAFIPNDPPDVLRRVVRSIGTALDWIEGGSPDDLREAAQLLHYCLDDLLSIPEKRTPGLTGREGVRDDNRHAESIADIR